ncbi:MAG: hypothetical protein K5739_06875, partial [Lachnospiraceae bacterium]|nr:hypothetical protein [Lachnospiraceae bacterium]
SGRGVGRGAAMVVMFAGVFLAMTAGVILFPRSIRELEESMPEADAIELNMTETCMTEMCKTDTGMTNNLG